MDRGRITMAETPDIKSAIEQARIDALDRADRISAKESEHLKLSQEAQKVEQQAETEKQWQTYNTRILAVNFGKWAMENSIPFDAHPHVKPKGLWWLMPSGVAESHTVQPEAWHVGTQQYWQHMDTGTLAQERKIWRGTSKYSVDEYGNFLEGRPNESGLDRTPASFIDLENMTEIIEGQTVQEILTKKIIDFCVENPGVEWDADN
jgi:hypothetical protein